MTNELTMLLRGKCVPGVFTFLDGDIVYEGHVLGDLQALGMVDSSWRKSESSVSRSVPARRVKPWRDSWRRRMAG